MKNLIFLRQTLFALATLFCASNLMQCACADVNVGAPSENVSGQFSVNVTGLERVSDGPKKYISVAYSGNLQDGNGPQYGETSFNISRNYEVQNGSISPNPTVTRRALKYGRWLVRVQSDSWSAECSCDLSASHSPRFVFDYPNTQGRCE